MERESFTRFADFEALRLHELNARPRAVDENLVRAQTDTGRVGLFGAGQVAGLEQTTAKP